ncbi:glucose-6-phosphate dehydrogenase assembly protein OpcA [Streptacidiphilus sp. PB12-B1b]|uniref:glucose-6-phosphate dehydrogenase assembly protein OpcA n=1 Tax=Streptacidiphilus sp. PB12-B1b TaxID=2705012 RepID=UPI0015FAB241|nr:glucose-6-phosphate dehydrogenase assembly protein OpcA [Streptacidiphilus sp. PB12-B1b]QMU78606.1 glucose-6-phosphate dehydrogenase assembly protein OpcA [Streptacidiphilus sp. PB12-B1b]
MKIDLTDTTSSKINSGLIDARRSIGAGAVGMVLTLVIVTDEGSAYDALKAAGEASREHPSRILAVISRPGRSPRARAEARLDAEIRVGSDAGTGETVLLRLHGELASQAQSVVLPLLLPDAPVVVWWPENAPENPAKDPLGALAQRRITDAVSAESPVAQLATRAVTYSPGDTDLAWTRITPWRSMLAAALDQRHAEVESAVVEGESYNPSAELLALWLASRLKIDVDRVVTDGPGLTAVRLRTAGGDVTLDRSDGLLAKLSMPDQPDRMVALKRRDTAELIAEELRRLDPDDIYATSVKYGVDNLHQGADGTETVEAPASGSRKKAPEKASEKGSDKSEDKAEEKAPKLPQTGPVASATRTKAAPKAEGRKSGSS